MARRQLHTHLAEDLIDLAAADVPVGIELCRRSRNSHRASRHGPRSLQRLLEALHVALAALDLRQQVLGGRSAAARRVILEPHLGSQRLSGSRLHEHGVLCVGRRPVDHTVQLGQLCCLDFDRGSRECRCHHGIDAPLADRSEHGLHAIQTLDGHSQLHAALLRSDSATTLIGALGAYPNASRHIIC